jgi:hypothetical protein
MTFFSRPEFTGIHAYRERHSILYDLLKLATDRHFNKFVIGSALR